MSAVREDALNESERTAGVADVCLRNVVKVFGESVAVDDITLDVHHGEFFSLLGPSGCGKTTTLQMIGGFETPTKGQILLGEQDVSRVPAYKRDVNTVFQSYALFPHLDIYENIAFGLKRRKLPKDEIQQRVSEALRLVDLPGYEKRKVSELSGGQQQRIALARALVNEPRVLLLDEPLGALDLKLRKQMQTELKRIQQDVGITFLYVTHDQEEAMAMSDRLAVMNAGKIEQCGTPRAVYEDPATRFVASFLGASNLIAGRVSAGAGAAMAEVTLAEGQRVRVPGARITSGTTEVSVGIRPEKLHLEPVGEPVRDGYNAITGQVVFGTYLGVSNQYVVKGPGDTELVVYVQNLGLRAPGIGDTVRLSWLPEHTFVV